MELGESGVAIAYETAFLLQAFENPDCSVDQLGTITIDACENLRVLGILSLLVNADTDGFYHNLMRSGRYRVKYLERSAEELEDPYHSCSGRVSPLLDVVAAGDWLIAKNLIELSTDVWQHGKEYEDDYCFAQIIHGFSIGSGALVKEKLGQYEQYLDGRHDARFSVCEALGSKDQGAFDSAFVDYLEEHSSWIESRKEGPQTEEPKMLALREVYVDGLAILRLAERLGLRTENEYLFCPGLARRAMMVDFVE